jgi:hypothetical protein
MWTINYTETRLVSRHRGTLPVVLTAPHGGDKAPSEVPPRTGTSLPANCKFSKATDRWTRTITKGIAQCMLEVFGESPYVVVADFDREYIDANRRPECAYEDPDAKQYYDEFQNAIRNFVAEIRSQNGGLGLLFDIHGTGGKADDPAHLYLGTAEGNSDPVGSTVERLLKVDPQALWRRRSLRGFLETADYVISPKRAGIPETINGGYIVRTYGSSNNNGLDAIQIEIDDSIRDDEGKRNDLIRHLAYAIRNLVGQWADARTLAAIQSVHLFGGGKAPVAYSGNLLEIERRRATDDWALSLGGGAHNRGRVEIRNNTGAGEFPTPKRAGVLVLYDESGQDYYLWVDNQGRLRISASDPGSNSQSGTIVGTQP